MVTRSNTRRISTGGQAVKTSGATRAIRARVISLAAMGAVAAVSPIARAQVVTDTWVTGDTTGVWNSTSTTTDWKTAAYPNGNNFIATAGKGSLTTLTAAATVGEIYDTGGSGAGWNINGQGFTFTMDASGFGTTTNLFGDTAVAAIDNNYSANVFTIQPSLLIADTDLDLGSTAQTTGQLVLGVLGVTTINNSGNTGNAIAAHNVFFKGVETSAHVSITVNSAIGTSGAPIAIQDLSAGYVELFGQLGSKVTTVESSDTAGTGSRLILFNTSNAYTGNTIVDAAAYLNVGNFVGQVIPYNVGAGNVVVNGTLELAGNSQSINGLTGTGSVTNTKWDGAIGGSAVTLTLGYNNSSATYSGTIVGTSGRTIGLTKAGAGTQIFNNSGFVLTGNILVSGGTLQIGDGTNATASLGTNAFTDNANLAYNYNAAVTVANTITGTGTVTQIGSAPLTLNAAANTFSGGLMISNSSVLAGSAGTGVLGSGTVTMAATTTLDAAGNSPITGLLNSSSGTSVVTNSGSSNSVLTISGTGTMTYAGMINDGLSNTIGLTKTGTGTQTLTGINNYSGNTTVTAGKLVLGIGGSLANTAISVGSGAAFSTHPASGGILSAGSSGAGSLGATLTLNPGTGSFVGGGFDMLDNLIGTFDLNQQSGFSGTALTLGGSGSSTNAPLLSFEIGTSSTDELIVSTGLVSIGSTGAIINLVPLTGITSITPGNYTLISAPGGGLSPLNLSSNSIVIGSNSYAFSLANSTSTAEILTVSVNNTTPINAYWTGAAGTSWSSTSPTNFATDHTGTTPTNGIPGGGTNVFMTADNANTANFSTTLDGAFNINSLTFTGTGTNAATASVTIAAGANNGSLTLTATNSFQTASGTAYGPGVGLLVMAGSAAHTISAPVILGASQTWEIDNSAANPLTVSGVVSDGGLGYSLTKTGVGTLLLSGSNTYGGTTGSTTVTGGTLMTGATGALPAAIGLTVNGGTLDLGGFGQTVAGLSDGGVSTGAIINSGAAATLTANIATPSTYSGTFNGSTLSLTLTGGGSLALSGNNSISALTTTLSAVTISGPTAFSTSAAINGGTVTIPSTGSLKGGTTAPITIGDNGNMTVNGGAVTASAFTTESNGGSIVAVTGGGSITVAGNLAVDNETNGDIQGLVSLTSGTITANSATLGRSGYTAQNGAYITASTAADGIYVNGGILNITTTLGIGALNGLLSNASVRLDSGSITVGGTTTITDGNNRYGVLDIAGGTFTGPTIQIGSSQASATYAYGELLVRGTGVLNVGTIATGFAAQTGGSDLIELLGGTLYIGAGGITNGSGGSITPVINFGGTTYTTAPIVAASAAWSTAAPITLTNTTAGVSPTIQAANASGGAENITITGPIGGTGGFVKTGVGTLFLTDGNYYTGIATLNAGILNINGQYALGGAVYTGMKFNGGTLQYATAFTGNGTGDISENSGLTAEPVTIAAGGATIDTNGNAISYASGIGNAGTGSLTLIDSSGTTTGSLTLTSTDTYTGGTTVTAGASLILAASAALPTNTSLTVIHGGAVQIANHSTNATYVPAVSTLTNNGTIDITNNAMIFTNTSMGTITAQVAAAYNKGAWTGTNSSNGVITSSVAASDPTHLTGIGIATGLTTFEGAAVPATDVLVKYTYYGDANLSGTVDGSDYTLIDNGFTLGLTGWSNGDFNYDGVIDGSDYALIDNSYNTQGANIASEIASPTAQIAGAGTASAVPEPTTLGLLGMGAAGLLGRRRNRGSNLAAAAR